jgi:hypothetical protein
MKVNGPPAPEPAGRRALSAPRGRGLEAFPLIDRRPPHAVEEHAVEDSRPPEYGAVSAAPKARRELAGAASVREAGIPPRSERDSEVQD